MTTVLPPSMSRIYIHNVCYKNQCFIDENNANEIVELILYIKTNVIKELQFQSVKIINVHNLNSISAEIHINNIIYCLHRVLTLDMIDKLRRDLSLQLRKNTDFSFEQMNIINDEYIVTPTAGYYDGE